jgi:hypothetical protein
VEEQAYRNNPNFGKEKQHDIRPDGIPGMQRMVTDAATPRIENGISQQMVQVDQHGGDHEQPGPLPVSAKKPPGDQTGEKKVQAVVDDRLQE